MNIAIYEKIEEEEAKILSLQLMETSEVTCLTTIDEEGFPRTRAMENLRNIKENSNLALLFKEHREDFRVLIATNTNSTKIRHIRKNPASSVFYCNPSEYRGLMLSGSIEMVMDVVLKKKVWQERWRPIYPRGKDDPGYSVLSLRPTRGVYYHWDHQTEFAILQEKRCDRNVMREMEEEEGK